MQSTTTVVCRALVMVVCLITIPLAALFGTSLPDIIKTLGWGDSPVSAREQGGLAPTYSASIPAAAGLPDDLRTEQAGFNKSVAAHAPAPAPAQTATEAPSFNDGTIPVNFGQRATVPVVRQASGARFEQIQEQLQRLGATGFLLEWFGTSRQLYRFQCEMPLGRSSPGGQARGGGPATVQHAVRHFEATSENSLQAMENVLAEIEAWLRSR